MAIVAVNIILLVDGEEAAYEVHNAAKAILEDVVAMVERRSHAILENWNVVIKK